jgi:opacity protein-like surface antigen
MACMLGLTSTAFAQEPAPTGGFRPRVVREGTLSLGLQGQYGTLLGHTGFGAVYDRGPGLGVRVRYRFGEDQAFGASFEAQRFDAKNPSQGPLEPSWLQAITTTAEYYQYFRTRKRTPQYLLIGAGLAQTRRHLENGEVDFPGDGGVLTLGGGTEYWFRRTLTFDLSARYYGFIKGENGSTRVTHGVQAALGLHYYTSR